jgi:transcriptional regulator with XRE-family HTH domain
MELFKNRLKSLSDEICESGRINQKDIADALDMSPQAFSYLIKKGQRPSPKTLDKMSRYFKVSKDYLLGKSNIKITESAVIESVGIAALKNHLDDCAATGTDLTVALNRLLGNTFKGLKDIKGDVDVLLLQNMSDVIKKWSYFIERAAPASDNLKVSANKTDAVIELYDTVDAIRNMMVDYGKVLIDQYYYKDEGDKNGDST